MEGGGDGQVLVREVDVLQQQPDVGRGCINRYGGCLPMALRLHFQQLPAHQEAHMTGHTERDFIVDWKPE